MMVNHDIAIVREFMFCTWPQLIMVKLFWQLIKKKLTSLEKPPTPLNYRKTLNCPIFCSPHYHALFENPAPPPPSPFTKEGGGNYEKVFKNGSSKICGRQPLKSFTWSVLEYFVPYMIYVYTLQGNLYG